MPRYERERERDSRRSTPRDERSFEDDRYSSRSVKSKRSSGRHYRHSRSGSTVDSGQSFVADGLAYRHPVVAYGRAYNPAREGGREERRRASPDSYLPSEDVVIAKPRREGRPRETRPPPARITTSPNGPKHKRAHSAAPAQYGDPTRSRKGIYVRAC
jgi:hypothetical protein